MLERLRQKIENRRNSNNLFWKSLVVTKDLLWKSLYATKNYSVHLHLFPNYKVVYVETPKAGCTSIKYALKDFRGEWNGPANEDFHKWFGYTIIPLKSLKKSLKTEYNDWIKFTVVRNPYDRFLSLYFDERKGLYKKSLDQTIKEFKKSYWYNDMHGRPQTKIIGEDLSIYDFVGRTEDMEKVFTVLTKIFKKTIKPIKENVGNKKKIKLNNNQRRIIYRLYKKDFEILGYKK